MDDNLIERCSEGYEQDDCVVFYGSLQLGRKLHGTSFVPGVYLNQRAFECTSYYPVFGDLLLHHNYMMVPYGDLIRRKEMLFEYYGSKDVNLFIRPNSGMKEFTGTVLNYDSWEDGITLAGFHGLDSDLLVVVSNAKIITKEYRFVVVNNEVISGSLYRDWSGAEELEPGATTTDFVLLNSKSVKAGCDNPDVWEFADKCAKRYSPDIVWIMDVVDGAMGPRLLEIGCFSCAGLYGNDLEKVVESVSHAAEEEWKDYFVI